MGFSAKRLAHNYVEVQDRISRAAELAGRHPSEIQLIAVTKYVDADIVRGLYELGCRRFGESRPQVLWQKAKELEDLAVEWHLIGHLQTNKVRRTLPHISLLHAGDSLKLLQCIDEEAAKIGKVQPVLCELNISGDQTKHGFTENQLIESIDSIGEMENLRVQGLMAMASREGGITQARKDFKNLEESYERLKPRVHGSFMLGELSIGMSGDFEEAIECGATLVRIGSILFNGVT